MATLSNPPKRNQANELRIALEDYANPGNLKVNPTIAAGDFMFSEDGAAFANMATLPTVSPAGSQGVFIPIAASEFDGYHVVIRGVDQTSPKEWADVWIDIFTTA